MVNFFNEIMNAFSGSGKHYHFQIVLHDALVVQFVEMVIASGGGKIQTPTLSKLITKQLVEMNI